MDSVSFDGYASYSDASTPRTPSPDEMVFEYGKQQDMDRRVRNIFPPTDDDHSQAFWQQPVFHRPSLLAELYDDADQSPPADALQDSWSQAQAQSQSQSQPQYTSLRRATFPYVRHDRDEGPAAYAPPPPPFMPHGGYHAQQLMADSLHFPRADRLYHGDGFLSSSSYDPAEHGIKLEDAGGMVPSQAPSFYHRSPNTSPHQHPLSHQHQHQSQAMHHLNMGYISPHTGLPVQHTDDAASKETQYLRRRCFNCHTTEPPSWRRSTLNPGKIVCNKCGLYERTHLRPRPLRFDELRAGNKARKAGKANGVAPAASPKQKPVKKELREYGSGGGGGGGGSLVRRSSVSSNGSVHSGSGASDWDDNVSLYSSTSASASGSSFNSPMQTPFPLRGSASPPHDGLQGFAGPMGSMTASNAMNSMGSMNATGMSIRLPTNPLSDIASMQSSNGADAETQMMHQQRMLNAAFHAQQAQQTLSASPRSSPHLAGNMNGQSALPAPRKSHTAPAPASSGPGVAAAYFSHSPSLSALPMGSNSNSPLLGALNPVGTLSTIPSAASSTHASPLMHGLPELALGLELGAGGLEESS